MAQQRQILNWMSDFTRNAAEAMAALEALNQSIAFYNALNLAEPENFPAEVFDMSEFDGIDRAQVWVTVDTIQFVIDSIREFGVFATVAPLLSAPPRPSR